ncbi:sulfate transporter 1;3 [Hibiscus trionum]|uniref:Sulfate transporter 13 n=1 Tax=Hibiscus trionum TaxID=183268 RepID=A0A9W7MPJ9_HIBTR|nr:sulfate transporter 1;3 [Hibiscus trionum]
MAHPETEEHGSKEMESVSSSSSRRGSESSTYIHKVGVPPKLNLFKEIAAAVKETLFADEPLRQFKDQPSSRKFVLGLQAIFPILEWGRDYNLSKFKGDLIAGLTIASLCIPQDIGYAKLANLDPQYGLYFLSHAAVVGFMAGAAITIALQQLKGLLGIKRFTKDTDIVSVVDSVISSARHGWNWQTILIGISFLIFLLVTKHIVRSNPFLQKKFSSFNLNDHEKAILGKVPRTETVYRNILQYPDATKVPGILIVRVDSAIYFSNSNYVKERILRWLADEEEQKGKSQPRIQYLIVEMCPVTDIDTSGIHALQELFRALEKKNIKLVISNPGPVVVDKLHASKFPDLIGEERIFLTVADAVRICSSKLELDP